VETSRTEFLIDLFQLDPLGVQLVEIFGGCDSTVVGQLRGTVGATKGYQYGYSVTNRWRFVGSGRT